MPCRTLLGSHSVPITSGDVNRIPLFSNCCSKDLVQATCDGYREGLFLRRDEGCRFVVRSSTALLMD